MFTEVNNIDIKSISCCVPKQVYSIMEYAPDLLKTEKTAKRMAKSTGITSLRIAPDNVTTSDLFQKASEPILNEIDRSEIGALVFVTQTPDYDAPATSHILQHKMGLSENTLCLDINEGCSGYVTGLYMATMLADKLQAPILLGAGDTCSKGTSPKDRATRCIFGDAATSTLVTPGHHKASFAFKSYGERWKAIIIENSAYRHVENPLNDGHTYLDGMAIMEFSLNEVPEVMESLIQKCNLVKDDIDLFACHQANKLILTSLAQKLDVPAERVPWVSKHVGNESSASIPMVLCNQPDMTVLKNVFCSGFGIGLSIGGCITDFSDTKTFGVNVL